MVSTYWKSATDIFREELIRRQVPDHVVDAAIKAAQLRVLMQAKRMGDEQRKKLVGWLPPRENGK